MTARLLTEDADYRCDGGSSSSDSKLAADPRWQAFMPRILPYLVHQESVFLAPVPFCPAD
jgi:hypothetical protein